MNLGTKIVGAVLVAFALALGLIAVVQRLYVAPSFEQLEREEADRNVGRVLGALARELDLLGVSAADWAYWDETHGFASGGGEDTGYLDLNLNLSAIDTLDVNLIAVYDLAGRRLVGYTVDIESLEHVDLGLLSADALPADHPLLRLRDDTAEVSGLVDTPAGVVAVAARNVLTNEQEGPPAGVLVIGRLLDDDRVADLAEQTLVDVAVEPWTAPLDEAWTRHRGLAHTAPVQVVGRDERSSSTVLADLHGRPVLRVEISEPRHITARGDAAMRTALGSTVALGVAIMALLLLVLNRLVARPLRQLTSHAARVGEDDLRVRLDLRRRDEIGALGRAFDAMTDRLAAARRALLERAFDAGKAELAAGVLHNVGNVVTPLVVRLVDALEGLRRLPAAEVEAAVAELEAGAAEPERAAALRRFVSLAANELAGAVQRTGEELGAVTRQVGHVQRILGEQERFSRAAPVAEPLNLPEMLEEGVRMLSPAMQRSMTVEVEPSVAALDPLHAPRIAVQQVIGNLLINAAEAIAARGDGTGRLRVSAERRRERGRAAVELRFEDDGVGLAADDLARVFERGFSTKGRASGLGLHWCATTVQALGGAMRLESAGVGSGATMRLLLPMDTAAATAPEAR